MSGPTLTVSEVAARYSVGPATVASWVRSGELKAVDVSRSPGGRKPRWRIMREALAAFEVARGAPCPAAFRQRRKQATPGHVVTFYQ